MFLEEDKTEITKDQKEVFGRHMETKRPTSNIFVLLFGMLIIALLSGALLYKLFYKPSDKQVKAPVKTVSTSTIVKLPDDESANRDDQYDLGTSSDKLIAENISFGYFYAKPEKNYDFMFNSYELPLNIKTDVINYYDVSRKINLDEYLDDLNNYGYAILDKQTEIKNADFFAAYHDLADKDLPIVITNDFILYFYQNTLKDVYKEIEKTVFYEHVWFLNKALYDISLARYRTTLSEIGSINNPVLEGQRLQLAYLAMTLKLLMPREEQIVEDINFNDPNKFNAQEADKYSFAIPEFLQADLEREYNLIVNGKKNEKSPIMLYPIDYAKFIVPTNYKENAKLNNFYLTVEWLKTVFPLYYINSDCEDCLLDKDDWVLNFYAAARTAKDLYENQELKNQWAIIYKFISFFSGLRQDTTYLSYHSAWAELFGKNYNLEKIFSLDNDGRNDDLQKIQAKISQLRYSQIEGEIDREDKSLLSSIGMRLLQEDYWPNDYIFKELSGQEIILNSEANAKVLPKTACASREQAAYRCRGFGYDIINLIQPVSSGSQYFRDNINYAGYGERVSNLEREMSYFNQNTWNNNIYWLTLDVLKPLLAYGKQNRPVYVKSEKWQQEKDYQTALGAWVNLHLEDDILALYSGRSENTRSLGFYNSGCNLNNYIELNPELLDELIARNVMLVKMLSVLKVDKDTNAASLELKDLNAKLEQLLVISKKILNNQIINDLDCSILDEFARHYSVVKKAKKSFSISSTAKASTQSIENIKIIAIIHNKINEKVIVFGPIFDYQE